MSVSFFSKRIKMLRLAYDLSAKDLSENLHLKSAANITFWEQGKTLPSIAVLSNLVSFFGVSADWFLGISDTPYHNETLLEIEENILNQEYDFMDGKGLQSVKSQNFIPDEYKYPELRQENYSLDVRGNLVFLLNNISSFYGMFTNIDLGIPCNESSDKLFTENKVLLQYILNRPELEKKTQNRDKCLRYTKMLLKSKIEAEPIYKISINESQDKIVNNL